MIVARIFALIDGSEWFQDFLAQGKEIWQRNQFGLRFKNQMMIPRDASLIKFRSKNFSWLLYTKIGEPRGREFFLAKFNFEKGNPSWCAWFFE